jgi:hypothetical protein
LKLDGSFQNQTSDLGWNASYIHHPARDRGLWFDLEIADLRVVHTIKYDNLKKEFIVRRSWKNNAAEIISFEEAQQWMNRSQPQIIPLSRMETQYQLLPKRSEQENHLIFTTSCFHFVLGRRNGLVYYHSPERELKLLPELKGRKLRTIPA